MSKSDQDDQGPGRSQPKVTDSSFIGSTGSRYISHEHVGMARGFTDRHFRKVCQFGFVHGQCRCPSRDKVDIQIICDMLADHMDRHGPVAVPNPVPVPISDNVPPKLPTATFPDTDTSVRLDSFTVPIPDFGPNSDGKILTWLGTDAVRWARLYQRTRTATVNSSDELMNLVGYFANAIGAGELAAKGEQVKDCTCGKSVLFANVAKSFPARTENGTVHREDGPCYSSEERYPPDAPRGRGLGGIPILGTLDNDG